MTGLLLAAVLAQSAGEAAVGLAKGAFASPFEPMHVTGPYAGTRMCPVCEWAQSPMAMVWVNGAPEADVRAVVQGIQAGVAEAGSAGVKAFLIDANVAGADDAAKSRLAGWAEAWATPDVFLMYRPATLKTALKNYRLDATDSWKLVVITVNKRRVVQSWPAATAADAAAVRQAVAGLVKK